MAIFNSYVKLPEGIRTIVFDAFWMKHDETQISISYRLRDLQSMRVQIVLLWNAGGEVHGFAMAQNIPKPT